MREGRRSEDLAPGVKLLEGAGLDGATGAEDERPERSGHTAGVLKRFGPGSESEDVVDRVARPVGDRDRRVVMSAGGGRPSVLRSERDDGDVDFGDAGGAGDAEIGSELSTGDERLEDNTEFGVR